MSLTKVSLVSIRLELSDNAPFVSLSWFGEDGITTCGSSSQLMSLDSKETTTAAKNLEKMELNLECRGERKPQELVVETYERTSSSSTNRTPSEQPTTPAVTAEAQLVSDTDRSTSEPPSVVPKDKSEGLEKVPFFSGNPFVERTNGMLHIYKQNVDVSAGGVSTMLCMIAVPATLSCRELLRFIASADTAAAQIRVIRDQSPNQYMVMLRFKTMTEADDFYKSFNGVPFNSIEEEACHLVYVGKVETLLECGSLPPMEGLTELPTCPVCLERMDESVDGVLTILCNHSFHGSCLSKWGDSSCPVCRFCQTPELTPDQKCGECGKQTDLWICLICGYIGCGRYAEAHAHGHFQRTSHTFAMQVGGQGRVWDYAGDNYVHRLIQSKTDGKVVEYEPQHRPADQVCCDDEKIEAVTLEYTYLLTNQLESQRAFFEEKLEGRDKDAKAQISRLEGEITRVSAECSTATDGLRQCRKEKEQLERKLAQIQTKLTKLTAELKEERDVNEALRGDQNSWRQQVESLTSQLEKDKNHYQQRVSELEEQLGDVLLHLDASKKVEEVAEAEGGIDSFGVTPRDDPKTTGRRRKTKR